MIAHEALGLKDINGTDILPLHMSTENGIAQKIPVWLRRRTRVADDPRHRDPSVEQEIDAWISHRQAK